MTSEKRLRDHYWADEWQSALRKNYPSALHIKADEPDDLNKAVRQLVELIQSENEDR